MACWRYLWHFLVPGTYRIIVRSFHRFHRFKNNIDGHDDNPPPPPPPSSSSSLYSKTKSMLHLGSFRSNPSFGSLAEESEGEGEEEEEAEDEYEEEERRELERLRRRRRQSEHFSFGVKPPPS